jgi:hypothetical protein
MSAYIPALRSFHFAYCGDVLLTDRIRLWVRQAGWRWEEQLVQTRCVEKRMRAGWENEGRKEGKHTL